MAEQRKNGKISETDSIDTTTSIKLIHSDTLCGCGPCQPASVQRWSHPVVFTAHAGIILGIFICSVSYFNGMLTTIERAFQLSSSEVAALTVLNDASSLSLILFVTYFGHKSHRPRWVAMGAIVVAIGLIFCALPHFVIDPIDPQSLIAGGTETAGDIGASNQGSPKSGVCDSNLKSVGNHSYGSHYFSNGTIDKCQEASSGGLGPVKWLVIGQIIVGFGSAPMFPLVLSYIDDAVKKHKFTSYTAFLFITTAIGPIGGFFLTSTAAALYVDFDRIPEDEIPDIKHYDPRWIGAWWLGFPLFSLLLIIPAVPMFFYPKVMIRKNVEACIEEDPEKEEKFEDTASIAMTTRGIFAHASGGIVEALKGVFLAIKRLVFNGALILLCLGAASETAIGVISSTFKVKYLQTQFGTSPSAAAILMGAVMVPSVILAQVVSAIICRRRKLNAKQCAGFIVGCHIVGFFAIVLQLFIGCGNSPVAGINTPYWNSDIYTTDQPATVFTSPGYQPVDMLQLKSPCNAKCECPDEIFRPVCGADGVSYISPCHAGCTQFNTSGAMKYSQCACIAAGNSSFGGIVERTAVSGLCQESCDSNKQLALLIIVASIVAFVMGLIFNPQVFVTFRLVEEDDRSIAMGVKSVLTKCLAYFPAPILMGMMINSTCVLWQYTCGERGSCWLYDVMTYRYLYIGIPLALKLISISCYGGVYLAIKVPKENGNDLEENDMKILTTN